MTAGVPPCFSALAGVSWSRGQATDAEIFARDVDGAAVTYLYAYVTDRLADDDEPNTRGSWETASGPCSTSVCQARARPKRSSRASAWTWER